MGKAEMEKGMALFDKLKCKDPADTAEKPTKKSKGKQGHATLNSEIRRALKSGPKTLKSVKSTLNKSKVASKKIITALKKDFAPFGREDRRTTVVAKKAAKKLTKRVRRVPKKVNMFTGVIKEPVSTLEAAPVRRMIKNTNANATES